MRAAKKFELVFFVAVVFWNINFQVIFGHIIEHKVNSLFTRTPLMCGSHCSVCITPGWERGESSCTDHPQVASSSDQSSGPFHGGSSMHVHQRGQREPAGLGNSLTQRELLAPVCYKRWKSI